MARYDNGHGWNCIFNKEVDCFGISIGAEIGMGGGTANMVTMPYSYNDYYDGVTQGLIVYDNKTPFKDIVTWPYMLRAGIYYKQKTGIYLAANVLYGGYTYNAADSYLAFDCTASGYSCNYQGIQINSLDFTHTLFGGGGRIGYAISSDDIAASLVGFVGGGVLKDVGSSMKSKGGYAINQTLDNLFPFWEIGLMLRSFKYVSLETSYRHLCNGNDDTSWASIGAFNIGIGLLLPVW